MNRLAPRRIVSRVHRWIGVAFGLPVVILGLSGAVLAWDGALDRLVHPGRYAVSGESVRAPSVYAAAARRALGPGDRIDTLARADGAGPVVVEAVAPAPATRVRVFLDPPTARVLGVQLGHGGDVLRRLHDRLLIPVGGAALVGLVGVALALGCLTGPWLPTGGPRPGALRGAQGKADAADFYRTVGAWSALPLLFLSVTGVWMAFAARSDEAARASPRARPLQRPALNVDEAVRRAGTRWRVVTWPTELSADWTVTRARGGAIKVADDTGTAAPARDQTGARPLVARLHDGEGAWPVWRIVVTLAGIAPALLAAAAIAAWRRERRT